MAVWNGEFTFAVNKYVKSGCNRTIHAEVNALTNVPKRYYKNCIIYVWRIRPNGSISMSKPCEKCQKYLRRKCIKIVYFSTDEGKFERFYPE